MRRDDVTEAERYGIGERGYVAACAADAGLVLDALPAHTLALRPTAPAPIPEGEGSRDA